MGSWTHVTNRSHQANESKESTDKHELNLVQVHVRDTIADPIRECFCGKREAVISCAPLHSSHRIVSNLPAGLVAMALLEINLCWAAPTVEERAQRAAQKDLLELTSFISAMLKTNRSVDARTVLEQLQRASCRLELPAVSNSRLDTKQVQAQARVSHLRVGWSYQCRQCPEQHLELAGGFVITSNGAAVTSYHVAEPPRDLKDGQLIAVDVDGRVLAVREILAAERYSDVCILRLAGKDFTPLPLSTNLQVGSTVCCLVGLSKNPGDFSCGVIERVFELPERRRINEPGAPLFKPTRFHASLEWSAGDSGAAVLDESGNAVGVVCALLPKVDNQNSATNAPAVANSATLTYEAVSARDILRLVEAMSHK